MKPTRMLSWALLVIGALSAWCNPPAHAQTVPATGEVTKINSEQGKITLRHGPIKNLDMDSMTMVFTVADPAMLGSVKPGDRVVFEADRVNGRITIVKLRKAKG